MWRMLRDLLTGLPLDDTTGPGYVPVADNGEAKISDPEQIPETYCDISAKDTGERYLGLQTDTVYVKVNPWELDV